MLNQLHPFAALALATCLSAGLVWALCSNLKYNIDTAYVRVLFLGFTLRKVPLTDIEFADKTWKWCNEHYNNTLNPRRIVRLRRRTGLFRNFIVTPKEPDHFLRELASRGVALREES